MVLALVVSITNSICGTASKRMFSHHQLDTKTAPGVSSLTSSVFSSLTNVKTFSIVMTFSPALRDIG